MAWDTKSRNNKNVKRLKRQIEQSEFEYREYRTPKIRVKSTDDVLIDMLWFDLPYRSHNSARNWKLYRKNQYKG